MTSPIDNGFARIDKESIKRQHWVPWALTAEDIAYDATFNVKQAIDAWGSWWSLWAIIWPASSTNNALARFDWTTWQLAKNWIITESNYWVLWNVNSVAFDTTPTITYNAEWVIKWNNVDKTIDINQWNNVVQQVGQEMYWRGKNQSWSTISNGTVVYANGAIGASGIITILPNIADGSISWKYVLGITTEDIANGADGFITT